MKAPWSSICGVPALTAAAILVSACQPAEERPALSSQQRQVGAFTAVDMKGAGNISIEIGPETSLTLRGSQRMLDHVSSEVHDGTLVLRHHGKWTWIGGDDRLQVHIIVPKLQELQLAGAGDVNLIGLNGGETKVELSGAGHIEAKGRLDKLTASINGAGSGDFTQVAAGEATVTVNGAGSIDVHAIEALDATINGVGSVVYDGEPKRIHSALHGVGTITRSSSHRHAREARNEADSASTSL